MHAYGWNGILPGKNSLGMSSFYCVSVVSVPDGLVKAHFLCISVLYHHLLCCSSAECSGGPVMTCLWSFFYFRICFFSSGSVGITLAGVLEHKGTLYETFLSSVVLVTELTMAFALASFGILLFLSEWKWNRIVAKRGLLCLQNIEGWGY